MVIAGGIVSVVVTVSATHTPLDKWNPVGHVVIVSATHTPLERCCPVGHVTISGTHTPLDRCCPVGHVVGGGMVVVGAVTRIHTHGNHPLLSGLCIEVATRYRPAVRVFGIGSGIFHGPATGA